jgi:hypothetical protein
MCLILTLLNDAGNTVDVVGAFGDYENQPYAEGFLSTDKMTS